MRLPKFGANIVLIGFEIHFVEPAVKTTKTKKNQ